MLWVSKHQTDEIALPSKGAEYVASAQSMCELIPARLMTQAKAFDIKFDGVWPPSIVFQGNNHGLFEFQIQTDCRFKCCSDAAVYLCGED